ncbi:cytochrome P450 71A1-like protein [Tanacetum coccineum]
MSDLSDHLWRLSKRYGPLMSIRLGMVQTLVVSSAEMAKEVMKTNDLNFCTRPVLTGLKKISYDNKDLAFSPYSEYWRQMRKICMVNLFSLKHINLFRGVREEEVINMIDTIKTQILTKQVVNLSEIVMILTSNIISRVAFGTTSAAYAGEQQEVIRFQKNLIARLEKNVKDMDEFYQQLIDEHLNPDRPNIMQEDMVDILLKLKHDPDSSVKLTFDHIKAVLMKLQQEVRNVIGNKGKVNEDDLDKLKYLKAVIKETLRLYPVTPLLVQREAIDRCVINGYEIPKKTLVYVNVWAVGRDPNCWERPEEFEPERFMGSGSSIDYKGTDFELIPFGSGRRICPGISMAAVTMEMTLSNLIYSFDWESPVKAQEIDTLKSPGTVTHKKNAL